MKQSMNENRPVGAVDQGNRAELKQRKDRRWIALLMFSVMGIVAIFSLLGVILLEEEKVVLQGRIEATEIRISGKLPGRVVDFCVKEGEAVRAGDTLVWISSPEAEAKYRQAYAMEEVARYQNEKVDEGTRKQIIQSAMQLWNMSRVDLELARSTYRRVQALYRDSVVTPQREEEVKAAYLSAQAGEKAAHQQYLLALEGAQKQDKESAQAMVSAAKASVAQVDALLPDGPRSGRDFMHLSAARGAGGCRNAHHEPGGAHGLLCGAECARGLYALLPDGGVVSWTGAGTGGGGNNLPHRLYLAAGELRYLAFYAAEWRV
jgi:multidrug efflux pump subunit AcrA (membrane-fusion protein)